MGMGVAHAPQRGGASQGVGKMGRWGRGKAEPRTGCETAAADLAVRHARKAAKRQAGPTAQHKHKKAGGPQRGRHTFAQRLSSSALPMVSVSAESVMAMVMGTSSVVSSVSLYCTM